MGIYEDIKDICLEAQKHDKTAKKAEKVLSWLDSPSCPLTDENEL